MIANIFFLLHHLCRASLLSALFFDRLVYTLLQSQLLLFCYTPLPSALFFDRLVYTPLQSQLCLFRPCTPLSCLANHPLLILQRLRLLCRLPCLIALSTKGFIPDDLPPLLRFLFCVLPTLLVCAVGIIKCDRVHEAHKASLA